MLQLKYRRGEYYTTLLKFLPCKYQSSLHYFPMSNGVNKLELGYDLWFYGLWHIIFLWAGEWTCQSCVMTSLHPKRQHALPGFECRSLVKSAVSTPAFYRWGNWGRAERWDQPRSPKRKARVMMCPLLPGIPVLLSLRGGALLCTQWKPKRWLLWLLTPLRQKLPELAGELSSWGLYKQHTLWNSRAYLMLHRASASWSTFFSFLFLVLGCIFCSGTAWAQKWGSCSTWSYPEEETSFWNTFKRTVVSRLCLSLSNTVSLWMDCFSVTWFSFYLCWYLNKKKYCSSTES